MATSRFPGFYRLSLDERIQKVGAWADLTEGEISSLSHQGLDVNLACQMVENVVGTLELPLGVAVNFIVNGQEYLVPMAVEEASVIAAASHGAKLARKTGGFDASAAPPVMIGQVQIINVSDAAQVRETIKKNKNKILHAANQANPRMVDRGGGAIDVETRVVETSSGPAFVVHVLFDTRDAMGANVVNSAVEAVASVLAKLSGGQVNMSVVSNLADRRVVSARCQIPVSEFGVDGATVARKIVEASNFAVADVYRAVTHNKGILNAIDAVCLATGNDWRAVEAAAHAYAARMDSGYRSLSTWDLGDTGDLLGYIELPVPVGVVGGATRAHPVSRVALKILGVGSATELAQVMAATGLAENLATLRALVTEGLQQGHMRLHARQVALAAASGDQRTPPVSSQTADKTRITAERALKMLDSGEFD